MDESIISKDLVTIDKDSHLHAALEIMQKRHISRLIVTEGGNIVGILAEEDIANRLADGKERKLKAEHIHISGAMTKDPVSIDVGASLRDAAKIMLEKKFSSLLVKKEGAVIGLITKTDLVKTLCSSKKEVKEFCTPNPVTVKPEETIVSVRKTMLARNIHRAPVMDNGALVGMLTERDIAKGLDTFRKAIDKYPQADIKRLTVNLVMRPAPITVKPDTSIGKAAGIMIEKKISGLPVVNEKMGIITKTDLIKGIAAGKLP
ncbi:MAG: CBS domain-containing protein [Candidatus Altiarchaeia archaeon]